MFITNWAHLDPATAGVTVNDFAFLNGVLDYRPTTGTQEIRKENSINTVGLIPTIIPVVHTDIIDPAKGPLYYLLDKKDLWNDTIRRGGDPLTAFLIYVMPDEDVTLDRIAQVVVKLNRVQKKMTDEELVSFLAPSYPEYEAIAKLMGQFTHVGIGEIINVLRPMSTNKQNKDDFENIAFVATHAARGFDTIELLDHIHEFLSNEERHNLLKKNNDFVFELSRRMIANPHLRISYAAAPGRGTISGTIPGNTLGSTSATTRGTIQFRNIANQVLRSDVDFPKRAFPKNNKIQRRNWNDRILTAMGII
jgi:hypothetical protein